MAIESREPLPTLERVSHVGDSAMLVVVGGSFKGRRFKIDSATTLGRSPVATVMLDDPEVSRLHARCSPVDGGFEIEDLQSRNGTFVNGERIAHQRLALGDKIRLGPHSTLEFRSIDVLEDTIVQRQRFEAIGRLGIGIAHDMKNTLAALDAGVVFLADLPADRPMGDAETRECLADLGLAVTRATQLARDLLSFARGRGTDRGTLDLAGLVSDVGRMLRHTLDHRVRIELGTPMSIYVHGSKSELHQVLMNLCLNARDAMPEGGVLRVRASVANSASAKAGLNGEPLLAELSVEDTGAGMDTETQSRIFTQFFTTKREGAGYGLGLYTARELVLQHGGTISLQSVVGRGTRFTVHLPLLDADVGLLAATGERGPARVPKRPASTRTVLLVDDEPTVRRGMARLLKRAGFEVREAASCAEAVESYRSTATDLVLLDLNMPGLDGEATQARLLTVDPDVRIVFATGDGDMRRHGALLARGALAVLEKPYSLDTLFAALSEYRPEEPSRT
jgi:two-component system, cell cycle sensor histidine kinase and response regulator CckA